MDRYVGKEIKLTGKISSQIIIQGNSQSFSVGKIRVRTKLYPAYHYGDKVIISGSLQRQVINRWYSRFSLLYPNIELIQAGNNKFIGLKTALENWYSRVLPEPEASLLAGIVLGSKRGLPPEFYQALQKTGTLHIVVASGYNVSVVLGAIIFLLAGILPRVQALILGLAAIAVYSFMAGMEPAIVRAAVMGGLACLAKILGRPGDSLRLLVWAGGGMLLVNPLFIWDIGFQLSFLATLGIILLAPRLPQFLPGGMKETLSAQAFVWPILWINFNSLSYIGILVNTLIVLFVPLSMALALLPWLAYAPLHLMVLIINWFG